MMLYITYGKCDTYNKSIKEDNLVKIYYRAKTLGQNVAHMMMLTLFITQ